MGAGEQDGRRKFHRRTALTPDVHDADQGEQATRRIFVHRHLVGESFAEDVGTFIVQTAPSHVDCFDATGRKCPDGINIAFAYKEVVLDDALQLRKEQGKVIQIVFGLIVYAKFKDTPFFYAEKNDIGAKFAVIESKAILLDEVKERRPTFLFDRRAQPDPLRLVNDNADNLFRQGGIIGHKNEDSSC